MTCVAMHRWDATEQLAISSLVGGFGRSLALGLFVA